ncbi:MAG: UvrD-helicase domain-containing protein [Desulfobacterales bacterium]|nr:MAG: UvrD-helicase domain-containing protein [Desulfobacterales bacterium]
MKFIADFHVHSRFSRATAKNLDLENLYIAAQLKGITVVGTGDFTHPGWFAEIKEKLVPAEPGLFKLKDKIAKYCDKQVPTSCRGKIRFILVSEISNIYKKNQKTRKNHNLVFIPALEIAERFNARLDKIGNIHSDGRPILGLDARDLLETLLDVSQASFLIPAHIWTPWFSLFGSKSGFDSIEECFEYLTSHVFAVETGLSSDPAMNWRVSGLDELTLISNSDAHSPLKMGREANLFNTTLSFSAIKAAMKTGDPERFLGTIEFYPEEGKYHLDGHRKCNVRLWPENTKKIKGICPVCQKPLTLGVMYRVEELADRSEGEKPKRTHPFYNLIPLVEILSEVLKVGPTSKKVKNNYMTLLKKLGAELTILRTLAIETIEGADVPLLGEAVKRMRQNKIKPLPGYDGEFGKINIFDSQEREALLGQKSLFVIPEQTTLIKNNEKAKPRFIKNTKPKIDDVKIDDQIKRGAPEGKVSSVFKELNRQQRLAVEHVGGPLMIIAGPGTGKTRTLTHRIAYLVEKQDAPPETILAIAFTNKAAAEMRERLEYILFNSKQLPFIGTFHSFCFKMLRDYEEKPPVIIGEEDRFTLIIDAMQQVEEHVEKITEKPQTVLDWIVFAKQHLIGPSDHANHVPDSKKHLFNAVYKAYQNILSLSGLFDFEDLIFKTVQRFETDIMFAKTIRNRFKFVFIDEYQDLNYGQYRMIMSLVPPNKPGRNICVIGDPDQSIYGFRGSDVKYFKGFIKDYPDATMLNLTRNYRSSKTILDASQQIINKHQAGDERIFSKIDGINTISVIEAPSARAEAVAIGKVIEDLIGGVGFHSFDFDKVDDTNRDNQRSFSDFAVLFRTHDQSRVFSDVFDSAGIPYQVVSRKRMFNEKGIKELISLLKIVEGSGCYVDFEKIITAKKWGFKKQEIHMFKNWCYKNSLSLSSSLLHAKRFPIKAITRNVQRKLVVFIDNIAKIKETIHGFTINKKLHYLVENAAFIKINRRDQTVIKAVNHLFDIAKRVDFDLSEFLSQIDLQTDTDAYAQHAEKVALMTMHAAKGLEFPVVFISGCENGYLPYIRFDKDGTDINEERRLFYVAATRTQDRLYLTYAKKRKIYGQTEIRKISPFVKDIEEGLKTYDKPVYGKKKKKDSEQLKLF